MSDQLEAPQEPIRPSPADTPPGPPRAQIAGSAEPAGRYAHWERIDVALTTHNGGSQTVSYRAWKDSLRQSDIDPDYLELKYQDPETPDRMGTAMFPRDAVVAIERRPILTRDDWMLEPVTDPPPAPLVADPDWLDSEFRGTG